MYIKENQERKEGKEVWEYRNVGIGIRDTKELDKTGQDTEGMKNEGRKQGRRERRKEGQGRKKGRKNGRSKKEGRKEGNKV